MKVVKLGSKSYKITVTPWATQRITAYQKTMAKYTQSDSLQERAKRYAEAVRNAKTLEEAAAISLDIMATPQIEPNFNQDDADKEIKEKVKAVMDIAVKPLPPEEEWDAAMAEVLIYSNENWGRVIRSSAEPFFPAKPNG